ncbi:MAG: DUF1823 family protein [Drouetiella hepatica Uher 2000/2452]|jgi:hypothetical protein|uniref:DUF1823 family protein n=1 Tax=Drouetiella hepatica Uher 2000/2452 TaxID=904376 RepID=A0A951Q9X7_9CYAN|nr:DUF1823 family protein [Drouetiella hepatica Uher 2000/2452]
MVKLPNFTQDTLWEILKDEMDDAAVNQLVWQCLGYRYDEHTRQWSSDSVAPEWRSEYPEPPDFIDSRPAVVKLTRSIPPENKQLLKEKLGFEGYKIHELTPRKTRRATMVNWLLSYCQTLPSR